MVATRIIAGNAVVIGIDKVYAVFVVGTDVVIAYGIVAGHV